MLTAVDTDRRAQVILQRRDSIVRRGQGKADDGISIVFTLCLLAVLGKLSHPGAKKDYIAQHQEEIGHDILVFKEVFSIADIESDKLSSHYQHAIVDKADITHYAKRLVALFPGSHLLFETLLKQLFQYLDVAGYVSASHYKQLQIVGRAFGFNDAFIRGTVYESLVPRGSSAYEILSVDKTIHYVALKKAYRQAIRDCHPDAMIARQVEGELADIFEAQYQAYTKAYEEIKRDRKFR